MISITVDDQVFIVNNNNKLTIYEILKTNGITIDTLCYNKENLNNKASCMACAVFDIEKNVFVASCHTVPYESMKLENTSERVYQFRKNAIELLLSEHRGSCFAFCERACPSNFKIPRFLNFIDNNDDDNALYLLKKYMPDCDNCKTQCEKACLRKRYDKPVKIKDFIYNYKKKLDKININLETSRNYKQNIKLDKKSYIHNYIKLTENELNELNETAGKKTECFQCECFAIDKCKLKTISAKYNASQFKYKEIKYNTIKKIKSDNIIFSPGKCIRCGTCISSSKLEYHHRGFLSIPSPSDGISYSEAIKDVKDKVISECPTGAFSE